MMKSRASDILTVLALRGDEKCASATALTSGPRLRPPPLPSSSISHATYRDQFGEEGRTDACAVTTARQVTDFTDHVDRVTVARAVRGGEARRARAGGSNFGEAERRGVEWSGRGQRGVADPPFESSGWARKGKRRSEEGGGGGGDRCSGVGAGPRRGDDGWTPFSVRRWWLGPTSVPRRRWSRTCSCRLAVGRYS